MLETGTLATLFHRLVDAAVRAQGIPASERTQAYLVELLTAFARPPQGDLLAPPLGVDFVTALRLPASERFHRLRRVADTALFLTGLFLEYVENTAVGASYYATLGRSAYGRLHADAPHGGLAPSFAELSRRFEDFVRVLGEISDRELFRSDRDTIRIYRRWLLTRGPREAAQLVRRGVIPFRPPDGTRH